MKKDECPVIGHGMCYNFLSPKLCYSEEEARQKSKVLGINIFFCKKCCFWHLTQMSQDKVKK